MSAIRILLFLLAIAFSASAQTKPPIYSFMNVSLGTGYNFGTAAPTDWGVTDLLSDRQPNGIELVQFNMDFYPVNKWKHWGWGISVGVQTGADADARQQGIRHDIENRYITNYWIGSDNLDQPTGETKFLTGPVYRYEALRWHFQAAVMLGFSTYDHSDFYVTLKQRDDNRLYRLRYSFAGAQRANFAVGGGLLLGYKITPFFSANVQIAPLYYHTSLSLNTSMQNYFSGEVITAEENNAASVFNTAVRINLMLSLSKKKRAK